MNIFKPKVSDIPQIVKLFREQYLYHYNLDPIYYVSNSEYLDKKFEEYITNAITKNDPNILVAEVDDNCVGFVTFKEESEKYFDTNIDRYGVVIELLIDEGQRGKGIGTKLMSEAENHFKAKGFKYMKLSCSTFNKPALDFYELLGYKNRQSLMFKEL